MEGSFKRLNRPASTQPPAPESVVSDDDADRIKPREIEREGGAGESGIIGQNPPRASTGSDVLCTPIDQN